MAFSTKRDGVKITIELNELLSIEFEGGACYVYVADTWIYLGFDIYATIDIETIVNQISFQETANKLFSDLLVLSRIVPQKSRRLEIRALNNAINVAKLIYDYHYNTQPKQANGTN